MKKSKLLEVLGGLSIQEMQDLELYLRSPYFHQLAVAEDELLLFTFLYDHFPDFEAADLDKEKVYEQIYPGSSFVKGKLEKRMSRLLKRIEKFMFLEEAKREENDFYNARLTTKFYRRKGLKRLYETSLISLQKQQAKIKKRGSLDLLHEFQIQEEISYYQSLYHTRKNDINLPNTLKSLDHFFLVTKLEYACALLSQTQFQNEVDLYDSLLYLDMLEPLLRDENYEKPPLVKVFAKVFFIFQMMRKEEEVGFSTIEELEEQLKLSEDYISFELLKYFHALCRNFYAWCSNTGNLEVRAKMFSVYRKHLEEGYLLYEGGITPSVFYNVVNIGLNAKEFDWVYAFMEDYKERIIGTKSPEDIYTFNMAIYFFRIGDYEKSLDLLVEDYEDLYYKLIAKRLRIKIYFETNSELLESRIDAFRFYLRRLSKKKLPKVQRDGNNSFINILKQILSPKNYNNASRKAKLREKIINIAVIKEKEWLLGKLE